MSMDGSAQPGTATAFPPALPLKKVVELLSRGKIKGTNVVLCKHLTQDKQKYSL